MPLTRGRGRVALAIVALAAAPAVGAAFVEGPLPGMTGGFGEPTCRQCHFDHPLNAAPGSVALSGVPEHYTPGRTYALVLTLRHPEMARGGFQVAARWADGDAAGRQAGRWVATGPGVQTIPAPSGGVVYLQHTRAGTAIATAGEIRWTLRWVAPGATGSAVAFHAAVNAANDDDSPLGDYIYTATARTEPPAGVVVRPAR